MKYNDNTIYKKFFGKMYLQVERQRIQKLLSDCVYLFPGFAELVLLFI